MANRPIIENNILINVNDLAVKTCPICQGYMQRFQLDKISKALGFEGRFHCLKCDYVEGISKLETHYKIVALEGI